MSRAPLRSGTDGLPVMAGRVRAAPWMALGLWGPTVILAAYLATRPRGIYVALALLGLCAVVCVARSAWLVAVCALPVMFIPGPAMPITILGRQPDLIVGLATAAATAIGLVVARRHRPSLWTCAAAVFLAVVGLLPGPLSGNLHTEGGLACAWISASLLGSLASHDFRYLRAFTYIAIPGAVLALFECVGAPNYWDRLTDATNFVNWPAFAGLHRAMGTFGHPLVASAVFATLTVMVVALRTTRGVPWLAVLYGAATLATLSRTGVAALAAGLAVLVVFPPAFASRGRIGAVIATVFVVVAVLAISPVGASLSSRIDQSDNAGREESVSILLHSVTSDPGSILFGGGISGAGNYLSSIGGNTATGLAGSETFDDQWITSVYDFGVVPLLLVIAFVCAGIATSEPRIRNVAAPPLAAIAVSQLFFDGLYWPSASFLAFFFIGMLTAFERPVVAHATVSRRSPAMLAARGAAVHGR